MSSTRLDLVLLEKNLASTRTKAQALIEAGGVKVNGKIVKKPGFSIEPLDEIQLVEKEYPYVSRGGLKLEAALKHFSINVEGKTCLDVGLSTGGFSHCLLLNGAKSVVGIDVGTNQVASSLLEDSRFKAYEKTDFRTVSASTLGSSFDFWCMDVSFISVEHLIEPLKKFLVPAAEGVCLVKPQFELSKADIGSGGIVRGKLKRDNALSRVERAFTEKGFLWKNKMISPVLGGDGNEESLLHLVLPSPQI